MDSETKAQDPQTEHLRALASEAGPGSDESREQEAGQYFGSQEEHGNRNEETSAEDAVIHTELVGWRLLIANRDAEDAAIRDVPVQHWPGDLGNLARLSVKRRPRKLDE